MKQIPGFPDYSITKSGMVWSKSQSEKGRWLKQRKVTGGYIQVVLWRSKRKNPRQVHRLVLKTYVGPCPSGMECRHLNGNPADNRLKNLKWGTQSENQLDSVRHGTKSNGRLGVYGEDSPSSKLSNQDRRFIAYQYSTGLFSQQELAKIYGVCQQTINLLVNGKHWLFVNIVEKMKALKIPRGQYA